MELVNDTVMEWLLEPFRHEFMQRALLGSALIGFTNGFLSAFVVIRRLVKTRKQHVIKV